MKFLLYVLMLSIITQCSYSQVLITSTPPTINTDSTLMIMMTLQMTIDASGSIKIQTPYPSIFKSASLTCSVVQPNGIKVTSCASSNSGQNATITLTNQISSSIANKTQVFLQLSTFRNPPSTFLATSFIVETFRSNGLLLESFKSGIYLTSLAPDTLINATLTPSSQIIGQQNTTLKVKFQLANTIYAGGYIRIYIPHWNPQSPNPMSMVDVTLLKCTINNIQTPCSLTDESTKDYVSLTDLSKVTSLAGTIYTIIIYGFRNPIIPTPIVEILFLIIVQNGFQIYTLDENGGKIDYIGALKVQVSGPTHLSNAQLSISSGSDVVQELSTMKLDFYFPFPLNSGCSLELQFPDDFSSIIQTLQKIYAFGLFGSLQNLQYSYNKQSNSVVIPNACPTYLDNTMTGSLQFSQMLNPSTVRQIGKSTFYIRDLNGNLIAYANKSLTLPSNYLKPGIIKIFNFTSSNGRIQESASLFISINPSHSLSVIAQIQIYIPKLNFTLNIKENCTVQKISLNLKNLLKCDFDVTSNGITLDKIFESTGYNSISSGPISFNLFNVIKNPKAQLKNYGKFVISTMELNNGELQIVDSITIDNPFDLQTGNFVSATIIGIVNKTDRNNSYLTFNITTSHSIPKNGNIVIEIPASLQSISSITVSELQGFQNQSVDYVYQKGFITISNGFTKQATQDQQELQFQVNGFTFPRYSGYLQDEIKIYTTDDATDIVDTSNLQIYLQAEELDVEVDTVSKVNGELTTIYFILNSNLDLLYNDYAQIKLPTQTRINNITMECLVNDDITEFEYDGEQTITLYINQTLMSDQSNNITISGYYNYNSTMPLKGFEFSILNQGSVVIGRSMILSIQNLFNSQFQSVLLTQSNSYPGQQSNYTFTITPSTLQYQSILLVIPPCITISNPKFLDYNENTIQVIKAEDKRYLFSGNLRYLKLVNISNPETQQMISQSMNSFQLISYSDTNGLFSQEEQLDGLEPSISCEIPCLTCNFNDKSYCKSCLNDQFVLDGQCVDACPLSHYTLNTICYSCGSDCESCNSVNKCEQCSKDSYNYYGSCVSECSLGSYLDFSKSNCYQCSRFCKGCSGNEYTCTSCKSNKLLFNNNCFSSCPDEFKPSDDNTQCVTVKSNIVFEVLYYLKKKLYYYPVLSLFALLLLTTVISVIRGRKQSNYMDIVISFASICETISIMYLGFASAFSLANDAYSIVLVALSFFFSISIILQNIIFMCITLNQKCCVNKEDKVVIEKYKEWKEKNKIVTVLFNIIRTMFSFHFIRFYDSKFFNCVLLKNEMFKESQMKRITYFRFTLINMVFPKAMGLVSYIYLYIQKVKYTTLLSSILENCILSIICIVLIAIQTILEQRSYSTNRTTGQPDYNEQVENKDNSEISYKSEHTLVQKSSATNNGKRQSTKGQQKLSKKNKYDEFVKPELSKKNALFNKGEYLQQNQDNSITKLKLDDLDQSESALDLEDSKHEDSNRNIPSEGEEQANISSIIIRMSSPLKGMPQEGSQFGIACDNINQEEEKMVFNQEVHQQNKLSFGVRRSSQIIQGMFQNLKSKRKSHAPQIDKFNAHDQL